MVSDSRYSRRTGAVASRFGTNEHPGAIEFVKTLVDNQGVRAVEVPTCGLCGERGHLLHRALVDQHFGAPGEWSFLRCEGCGLVWLTPRPEPEDMGRLYERYHTHEQAAGMSLFKRAVRRGIPAARMGYSDASLSALERGLGHALAVVGPLREVASHACMWLPAEQRGRLLDVGCGSGAFLLHMRELGWTVFGVDADASAVRLARAAIGENAVRVGGVDEAPCEAGSVDAVTLSHVIEHLLDPEESLRECHRLLRPGGWLVVATPNARSLGSAHFGSAWRGWEPPRHIQLYDSETLQRVAERTGFRVRTVQTPSAATFFMYLGSVLPASVSGAEAPAPADQLRALAFWAREYVLTRAGQRCGEEVVMIAEKGLD